jgi:putative phosphoribosyl transferase
MPRSRYRDRHEAGRILAEHLTPLVGRPDLVVLGLPRGGVPVAYEVARRLGAPLDVFVVRKLGVPGHEELAMGAVASGGTRVLNRQVIEMLGIEQPAIEHVASRELAEIVRRERVLGAVDMPRPSLRGATVLLVDDGLATGSTMRAAIAAVRSLGPARIIVAVPIAAAETCAALLDEADDLVCVATPTPFHAVGLWYDDFAQTSDEEVQELLSRAARERVAPGAASEAPGA